MAPFGTVHLGIPALEPGKKGLAFWLIFLSLCFSVFLSALEVTAVATALPSIISELDGAQFAWVGSAYSLASTAFLPMSGGAAEIFGRRVSMLGALVIFALGSALCGAAQSMHWLIAARAVQGLGGGAILSLSSIVISDLVSLSERGAYNGLIGLTWSIATALGPIVGGALASRHQWRWIFYLNLPICGASIAMVLLFLNLPTPKGTTREKLRQMDWIGNALVVASTTGVVLGLTWGGTTYPWRAPAVLVPLIVGGCGFVLTFLYEFFLAENPLIPFKILSNRTSLSGYIQNFLGPLVVVSLAYYVPVFYQACKDASPVHSGVLFLGATIAMGPAGIPAGIAVRKLQVYRPQLWLGWVLLIIGVAGLTTFTADMPSATAVCIPILFGAGTGFVYALTYFPILAPLHVSLNAPALAFLAFGRSFAGVWGITIGSTILQNELLKRLPPAFLAQLPGSGPAGHDLDLAFALIPSIKTLTEPLKTQVREAFVGALAVLWKTLAAILGLGLLASLAMRGLPLQNVLDERWTVGDHGERTLAAKENGKGDEDIEGIGCAKENDEKGDDAGKDEEGFKASVEKVGEV